MTKPIFSFFVLILSMLLAWLYVLPAYKSSQEHITDIAVLSKILDTSSGEIRTLINETKGNLSNITPEVSERFKIFLPEKIDAIRFANNLQNLGKKNRIILSGIKVDEQAAKAGEKELSVEGRALQGVANTFAIDAKVNQAEGDMSSNVMGSGLSSSSKKYAATKVTFSFDATYETFQLFLSDLERSLGLINVTSLSFVPIAEEETTKKSKTPPAPKYQYTMTIETYSLK